MKALLTLLMTFITSLTSTAQDITGQWSGELNIQGLKFRLVFNITKVENGLISTMDSPDEGAKGIQTTATIFEDSVLKVTITTAKIEFEGTLGKDEIIVGTFKQRGLSFPLSLSKKVLEKRARPQEPTKPYPYYSEDISFENKKAGIRLAGTLTLPRKDGVFPVVILISGSGPQNRDEQMFEHKPFLVISDYLTRNGIAVLRYDDRGTAQSNGNFLTATSLDFSTDVEAGVDYLKTRKEINKNKIGLIGHSEGGVIAPMVASRSKDVAFVVLLAGVGISGDQLALMQLKLFGKAAGESDETLRLKEVTYRKAYDMVHKSKNVVQLKNDLTIFFTQAIIDHPIIAKMDGVSADDFVQFQVTQMTNTWMHYFIRYDPAPTLEKVHCPVLALNGEKDLQVSARENLKAIKKALTKGGNKKVTVKELPVLNHLFQECNTGALSEYATIEQTFSPTALTEILRWLQMQIK